MDISTLLKVVGVGFLVSVAYQVLSRSGRDEQAMLVSIGGIILVLIMLMSGLSELVGTLRSLFGI